MIFTIILSIIGLCILLFFWGLIVKALSFIGSIFFNVIGAGISGTLGCLVKLILWPIIIFILLSVFVALLGI